MGEAGCDDEAVGSAGWLEIYKVPHGDPPLRRQPCVSTYATRRRSSTELLKTISFRFCPSDKLKGSAPEPDKNKHYVSRDDLRLLWAVCRNVRWRVMLGLCRLAGFRRGEALAMKWDSIDWDKRRITIIARKTGRRRVIPIDAELLTLLAEARDDEWREDHVVSTHDVARNALIDRLHKICEKAGLAKWADAFQELRRHCETDWARKYPQYAVSDWIGHDIRVSGKYYLQIPEELYDRAAGQ